MPKLATYFRSLALHGIRPSQARLAQLLAFLRDMPKGGDLHKDLAGAIYAESWIDFARREWSLCRSHKLKPDRTTLRFFLRTIHQQTRRALCLRRPVFTTL